MNLPNIRIIASHMIEPQRHSVQSLPRRIINLLPKSVLLSVAQPSLHVFLNLVERTGSVLLDVWFTYQPCRKVAQPASERMPVHEAAANQTANFSAVIARALVRRLFTIVCSPSRLVSKRNYNAGAPYSPAPHGT